MKKNVITAFLMTIATTILLGVFYPLVVTVIAQVAFHDKANGQIRYRDGRAIGSRIIGQPFTSANTSIRGPLPLAVVMMPLTLAEQTLVPRTRN